MASKVICDTCGSSINKNNINRHKLSKRCSQRKELPSTNDSHTTEQITIDVDSEMINLAIQLLEKYSTNQLNRLMLFYKQPHLMAHVESKLHRSDRTFRNMSCKDVFPLIIELNNIANHPYSDSSDSD